MSVFWRSSMILLIAVAAGAGAIDAFAINSPWVPVVAGGLAAAWLCSSPGAAAVCAIIAMTLLEGLVAWPAAEAAPGQALIHLAAAGLLAAAFSLTRPQRADNSATSQAEGQPESTALSCKEVRDED